MACQKTGQIFILTNYIVLSIPNLKYAFDSVIFQQIFAVVTKFNFYYNMS